MSNLHLPVSDITLSPIGKIISPYQEKFAIPRQPGLVTAAKGSVQLQGDVNNTELIRGLENFSHLWLIFIFHGTQDNGWQPLVRPPRLGGNQKLGVLATRSTYRPNPIGLSVVKFDGISITKNHDNKQQVNINISELDLLNNTPILDIKPYIPYCDSINNAEAGYAQTVPEPIIDVSFNEVALAYILRHQCQYPDLEQLIKQVLAQDPRPAYKKNKPDAKIYGMRLHHFNVQWKMIALHQCIVVNIEEYSA